MTCVPDGIIQSLTSEEFEKINLKKPISARSFMKAIKEHNKPTVNVMVQDKILTQKELNENVNRIREIDLNNLNNGYLCSSHEPLLNLICELFEVDINMNFNGSQVKYRNISNSTRVIDYSCSKTHFVANTNGDTNYSSDYSSDNSSSNTLYIILGIIFGLILFAMLYQVKKK